MKASPQGQFPFSIARITDPDRPRQVAAVKPVSGLGSLRSICASPFADRLFAVQDGTHLGHKGFHGERLLNEINTFLQHPVVSNDIARISRHVENLEIRGKPMVKPVASVKRSNILRRSARSTRSPMPYFPSTRCAGSFMVYSGGSCHSLAISFLHRQLLHLVFFFLSFELLRKVSANCNYYVTR